MPILGTAQTVERERGANVMRSFFLHSYYSIILTDNKTSLGDLLVIPRFQNKQRLFLWQHFLELLVLGTNAKDKDRAHISRRCCIFLSLRHRFFVA